MPDALDGDFSRSRAVLIGTWDYRYLSAVPAAEHSLNRMRALLAGPLCGGWPDDSILVVRNQSRPGDLPEQLTRRFHQAVDVALFYYVGHGQYDNDDELCLGLADSSDDAYLRTATSLPFDAVRKAFQSSRAVTKIAIVDCCYAELAAGRNTLGPQQPDLPRSAGFYLMMASGASYTAWFQSATDSAVPQTYFTKYLADVIERGIPGQPAALTLGPIFDRVSDALVSDGMPEPRHRSSDHAARYVFARNTAARPADPSAPPEAPRVRDRPMRPSERLGSSEPIAPAEPARPPRSMDRWDSGPPAWPVDRIEPPQPSSAAGAARMDAAADALTREVYQQWNQAAHDRKLYAPAPIPVRWQWSRRGVTGPMVAALGDSEGPVPFAPLPGVPAADDHTLNEGGLPDLFRVYGGLPSGRIALLGRPGSGKSETALLTALDALRHRSGLRNPVERANVPVPVLLSVTGWDASRDTLAAWAAARLAEDYPFLRQRRYGRRIPAKLVQEGRIALFLDGFDELEPGLRPAALKGIGQHSASRVMVFARTDEFADTIRAGHLPGTAVLELAPIPGPAAAEYLRRCQVEPAPEPWQRLVDHLRDQPDSVVSRALDIPLGLTLVRDAFPRPDGLVHLLDEDRFTTREEVMAYLLDRFISIAYQPHQLSEPVPYEAAQARRWLGYLAAKMTEHGTYSLDWRQLPRWVRPFPRIGMLSIVCVITAALGGALLYGWGRFYTHGVSGAGGGSAIGAVLGLVLGLAAGTASELRDTRSDGLGWRPSANSRRRLNVNPGVGAIVGIVIGIVSGDYAFNVTHNIATALAVLFAAGAGAGAVAGTAAMRVHPAPGRTWWSRTRALYSRLPLLPGAVAGGLPVGLRYMFPHGFSKEIHVLEGPLNGIWGMLMVSLIIGAARLPSQVGVRSDRHAIWRQERRRDVLFGVLFGLCVGLGFGLRESVMWDRDVVAGLFQTIGIAIPCALCVMIAGSDAGRSSLLFLQLHIKGAFPARGMNFLEDAYNRQVLRAEGPRYQFRHALLQDKLSQENALSLT
ncbi:caspase, EACC1-associated type [Kitasatospora acidiphila]|uniref:caspase, EACC1-associated type n=1 Tax=Kitasatospora acidiphila TaxID=2567942 RepID=UPI003C721CB0